MSTAKPYGESPTPAAQVAEGVPAYLVREAFGGKQYFYKGYREVLAGQKQPEDIMGSSVLQWAILDYLLELIYTSVYKKDFWVATTEAGLHLKRGQNMANDITLYAKRDLPASRFSTRYADVAPKFVIEVDVASEYDGTPMDYVHTKTQRLLDFGTERVIWIFTPSRKVMVAENGAQSWLTVDWNQDIAIMPDLEFNIEDFLQREGIDLNTKSE